MIGSFIWSAAIFAAAFVLAAVLLLGIASYAFLLGMIADRRASSEAYRNLLGFRLARSFLRSVISFLRAVCGIASTSFVRRGSFA